MLAYAFTQFRTVKVTSLNEVELAPLPKTNWYSMSANRPLSIRAVDLLSHACILFKATVGAHSMHAILVAIVWLRKLAFVLSITWKALFSYRTKPSVFDWSCYDLWIKSFARINVSMLMWETIHFVYCWRWMPIWSMLWTEYNYFQLHWLNQ